MQGKIVVSGGGRIRTFHLPGFSPGRQTPLPGSGALCAGGGFIYAASDEEHAVYRLEAGSLLPCGVYAGGPGMRALCLSEKGDRLFVLSADADSVLMLDARDGAPMMLARAGVCPQSMRLDDTGKRLVVAGGKDGCVRLLSARTLRLLACFPAKGTCLDASVKRGRVRALCLSEEGQAVPGRLIAAGETRLFLDRLNERLYAGTESGWRAICGDACDLCVTE